MGFSTGQFDLSQLLFKFKYFRWLVSKLIKYFVVQIRQAHELDPADDFHLVNKHTRILVDFDETTQASTVLSFDNEQFFIAMLNERYQKINTSSVRIGTSRVKTSDVT